MEDAGLETLLVNFEYLSGEGHDACGWMAVEGWIRVSVPPPFRFAWIPEVLLPSFVLGSLKGGRWILGFLGEFPLPFIFLSP